MTRKIYGGLFIVFEGVDGSGKSTQLVKVAERLTEEGFSVETTREPGGTRLGKKLRELLLNENGGENEVYSEKATMYLFAADRAEHVDKVLCPALEEEKIILCDRFIHSSFAYQGEEAWEVNKIAVSGVRNPDLVIILDVDKETCFKRMSDRPLDKIEEGVKGKLDSLIERYRTLAKEPNVVLIDGNDSEEDVQDRIWETITKLIKGENNG